MTGARITVVDDHPETLQLLRDILEGDGHTVSVWTQVDPQLHQVWQSSPDLLIVDLLLTTDPRGLSGWDVVRLAKSHAELHDKPCLVISADYPALRACEREAKRMHSVELMAKPFEVEALSAAVRRLLQDAPGAGSASAHLTRSPMHTEREGAAPGGG